MRGFTLLEVVVVAAIVAVVLFFAVSMPLGSRPAAAASSVLVFDETIAEAKSLAASSGNGATLIVAPATPGGFSMRVYAGRPNGAGAVVASGPAVTAAGDIAETSLGSPPFTIFFDSAGHASGMEGAVNTGAVIASDPGCPGNNAELSITISDTRTTSNRLLACTQSVSEP